MGVYSRRPSGVDWAQIDVPVATAEQFPAKAVAVVAEGEGTIDSFTVVYAQSQPAYGIVIGTLKATGERFVCVSVEDDAATLNQLLTVEPIGRSIQTNHQQGKNLFRFSNN